MIQDNLKQRLMVLRGTLRNACTIDGVSRVVLALVIGLVSGMLLDYCFFAGPTPSIVDTLFRVLILVGFLTTLTYIFYRRVLGPLSVPLSIDDMALSVEREFPHLNDSLISAVQLARIMADDRSVSTPMIEEVARHAHRETAALDFSRVVKFDRVKPVMHGAIGAVVVFTLLSLLLLPFVTVGLLRFINPFSTRPYPVRTFITIEDHDVIVPRNDAYVVVAKVTGALPSKAEIKFRHGKDGAWGKAEPITSVRTIDLKNGEVAKEFEYKYNPVLADFEYIVLAGDNFTEPRTVHAVDRPELLNMQVAYQLPTYITEKRTEFRRERTLRNVVGTKATIEGEVNKPLKSATLKVGDDSPREMLLSPDKKKFMDTINLDSSRDYEIVLLDQDGLDNTQQNQIRHKILAIPDALPKVVWKTPAVDLEVTPTGTVALSMSLEDDWGLQKSVIKYKRFKGVAPQDGNQPAGARNAPQQVVDSSSQPLMGNFDLPEPEPGAFNRTAQKLDITKDWTLGDLGLEPGDDVQYWAEAYDWCPTPRKGPDPQTYHLRILSPQDMLHHLDMERLKLIEDLKIIIQDQTADKQKVDHLKDDLNFGNKFETAERTKVSEAGAMQEDVRRKTVNLQHAFQTLIARYKANALDTPEDTDRLQNMADTLGVEHTTKMPEASKTIASTSMQKADADRVQQLLAASAKQEEILTDLRGLLEQMQKWAETEDLIRLTRELLLKQRSVTRLTSEYKDRLGTKKPGEASKEEIGQVKGLEHEQRDCMTDMNALYDPHMTAAFAKMQDLDKFVSKNIADAMKIAQNADATPENPDLPTAGDHMASIADKMAAAQDDIKNFEFGMAGGKQKICETALERIITVLSRRREPDPRMLQEAKELQRDLQRVLQQQRELTRQTTNIMNKQQLEQSVAQARQQLQQIMQRQQELKNQTENLNNKSDPQADKLNESLAAAQRELDQLVKDENKVFKDTVEALSPSELQVARAIQELEELEAEQRALGRESADLADNKADKALRESYDRIHALREKQHDLRDKTTAADAQADKTKSAAAMKELQAPQDTLSDDTRRALAAMPEAGQQLLKSAPKDSPNLPALQAAARALEQAASLALHAPDEMKTASEKLAATQGKDAINAEAEAMKKLGNAEEVLLKALGLQHKQFEDASIDVANRQANTRGKLDDITNRIANLVRAAAAPSDDPKLGDIAKGASKAIPDLEKSSEGMSEASDMLRQGAPRGDHAGSTKASVMQNGAADKIASARAALQGLSNEVAKQKQAIHDKNGQQQSNVQDKTTALQKQIEQLAGEIDKAHAAASGQKPPANANAAAKKVGEAAGHMSDAKGDLKKPDPSNATKNESKALDALADAGTALKDLKRKIDELQSPARRLERMQKELKEEARKLAGEVQDLEKQLPATETEPKSSDNIKNASNNMQNAENSLGKGDDSSPQKNGEGSKGGDQGSKGGDQGSKGGDSGSKSGDKGSDSGSKGGDKGSKGSDSGSKGGNDSQKGNENNGGPDKKEAADEQKQALTELEKAMKALDALAEKAKKENDPRAAEVLKRLEQRQAAVRAELEKLQPKVDALKDKSGNQKMDKVSQATESARKNQSAAGGQMGQGNQGGAKSSSEEAEKDIQEALDNLDQFQQQMQQQNRNEQLFQIEQELKKMLQVQKDTLTKTQEVDKQRPAPPDALPRRLKGLLKQIFDDQFKLADSTRVIVKKLEDSPVFQWVLQTATDDMNEAAARLDKEESGELTQEIQNDVIKKLGELIEALRKERTKPQQGGGGGGGGGGKQPLVPPLAELKMLQIMQRDVNLRTKQVDDEVMKAKDNNKELSKDQKERLRRTAKKEGDIYRVTKRIVKDISGDQQDNPLTPAGGQ